MLCCQTLTCNTHEKIQKGHVRTINLKHQLQHGIKNLNYLMSHTLFHIFKIILHIS